MSTTIQLRSGRYFDFTNPQPGDFEIEDIAHALSHLCRFTGHVRRFYSVAQHSVHVSELLEGTGLELYGLLHDASEAYTGDMNSPLKSLVPQFREIEDSVQAGVCLRFDLPLREPDEVKVADLQMLVIEQRILMPISLGDDVEWEFAKALPRPERTISILPWPSEHACRRFLDRFHVLSMRRGT